MTRIYGADLSHYDNTIDLATAKRMVAEGIAFATHKLGESLGGEDSTAGASLAALRDAGIQALGGYWFIHHGVDPGDQAQKCIAVADSVCPWWRTFDGWFWQTDAETAPSGLPTPAEVKAFSDELAALSGRKVIVYASRGMYGDRLTGLGHPLWNANYGSNHAGPFTTLYPGDDSSGWQPYSGQTPEILQYSSSATIVGHTTCDVNAFRGSLDDFLTLIGADMPLSQTDADLIVATLVKDVNFASLIWREADESHLDDVSGGGVDKGRPVAFTVAIKSIVTSSAATTATLAGLVKQVTALTALVQAGGGNADTASILAAIGAAESAIVTELQADKAALTAQVAALKAALAAGASAEAADLSK